METDLIWMSLCIFVPTLFALGLVFFPKGSEEAMRWWSLVGTANTFVISTFVFIDYRQMLDENPDPKMGRAEFKRPMESTTLESGPERASGAEPKFKPFDNHDQRARYPWIARFNIDYYLGVD